MRISKTRFITVIAAILIVIAGVAAYSYYQYLNSFYTVTVNNIRETTLSLYKDTLVTLSSSEDVETQRQEIKRFSEKKTEYTLQNGTYCIETIDQDYALTQTCFEVKDEDTSITINPSFSKLYLKNMLTSQLESQLNAIISEKYAPIIDGYVLKTGELLGEGDWYGATLTTIIPPRDRGDVYRVLLHNESGVWNIVAYPQLYLNKYDYPDVPQSVLQATNELVGSY